MATVSATEAKQRFAAVLDQAQREPVTIQRHDRDIAVLISADEFERMRQLRTSELLRLTEQSSHFAASRGLTDNLLDHLLADES